MTDSEKRKAAVKLLSRLTDDGIAGEVAGLLGDVDRDELVELLNLAVSELSPGNDAGDRACVLFVDGASIGNPGPAGAGASIQGGDGKEIATISKSLGTATSNVAEYRALILGLKEVRRLGFTSVKIFTDSELMANQVTGSWRIKDEKLKPLAAQAMELLDKFDSFELTAVRRTKNRRADQLAKRAADMGR
jgi:ribonuclease HI